MHDIESLTTHYNDTFQSHNIHKGFLPNIQWIGYTTVSNFKSYKPKVAVPDLVQENSYQTKFHMHFRKQKQKDIPNPWG